MNEIMSFCTGSDVVKIISTPYYTTSNCVLEPCKPAACEAPANQKRTNMSRYYDEYNDCYAEGQVSDTQDSRQYFRGRVSSISAEKDRDLMLQFGLRADDPPENFEDFMARIQAGKYQFKNEEGKSSRYWRDYIIWRDPAVKVDRKGYDAAWEAFSKERDKTLDIVMALPADKALEAVQALETWTAK